MFLFTALENARKQVVCLCFQWVQIGTLTFRAEVNLGTFSIKLTETKKKTVKKKTNTKNCLKK